MKENIGKSDIKRTHNLNIIPKVSNNTTEKIPRKFCY